jgi:sugar (pentulose or hexulose) kinase
MSTHLLGLDAGTSVTKAAIFDGSGRQIAAATRRIRVDRPHPGWSETDPEAAWSAACTVIREVIAASGLAPREIAAAGISAAMVGAWVTDAEGRPLRPGIFWEDSRAQRLIDRMIEKTPDLMSRLFAKSGSVMQQGCTLPVLRWLLDEEPATMARAAAVLSYKDFLRFRLTGTLAADPTEAAVAPGDARARDRSPEILALFGLSEAQSLLQPVRPSDSVAGSVTAAAAAATGLAEGTPVAIGAGDVSSTVIGAGALSAGTAVSILGTTCLNGIVLDAPSFAPPDLGLLFTMPGRTWLRTMVNVAGTTNLDWAVATLAPDLAGRPDLYAALEALIAPLPVGTEGLTWLPYLSESGIIAPVVSVGARAAFEGLAPRHGRAHLLRAVYEGVALSIRDCFDALEGRFEEVVLCGGGGRSVLWTQMIADVLQRRVVVPAGTEFGARGAALLAATAIGRFGSIREASAAARSIQRVQDPDAAAEPAWAAALALYRRRRDALIAAARH